MAQTLFFAVIFLQEKRDTAGNLTEPLEIISENPPVLYAAKSQQQAEMLAGQKVPAEIRDDPDKFDRLVVAVSPF